jgi:hypothetical protein
VLHLWWLFLFASGLHCCHCATYLPDLCRRQKNRYLLKIKRLVEVGAQKPGHFFVLLHQSGHKIAAAKIFVSATKHVHIFPAMNDDAFVIGQQFFDETAAVVFFAAYFA